MFEFQKLSFGRGIEEGDKEDTEIIGNEKYVESDSLQNHEDLG